MDASYYLIYIIGRPKFVSSFSVLDPWEIFERPLSLFFSHTISLLLLLLPLSHSTLKHRCRIILNTETISRSVQFHQNMKFQTHYLYEKLLPIAGIEPGSSQTKREHLLFLSLCSLNSKLTHFRHENKQSQSYLQLPNLFSVNFLSFDGEM